MRSHKPSMNWLLPLSALIGIFVVAGLLVGYTSSTSAQPTGAMGLPSKENLTRAIPEGIPAIQPRKTGLNSDMSVPTFTSEEAVSFITSAYNYGLGSGVTTEGLTRIVRTEFLKSSDLSARHKVSTGLPDNTLLLYVELAGRFSVEGSPHGGGLDGCSKAHLIYHGQTGNRLMFGIDCSQ